MRRMRPGATTSLLNMTPAAPPHRAPRHTVAHLRKRPVPPRRATTALNAHAALTPQDLAVLDGAAGDLLHLCVVLDVNVPLAVASVNGHALHGVQRQLLHARQHATRNPRTPSPASCMPPASCLHTLQGARRQSCRVAVAARTGMSMPNRCVNLVAMQLLTTLSISWRLAVSMGKDMRSTMCTASSSACEASSMGPPCRVRTRPPKASPVPGTGTLKRCMRLTLAKALTMTVGCRLRSRKGSETCRSSPAAQGRAARGGQGQVGSGPPARPAHSRGCQR